MKTACIIAVGNELTSGESLDTNSAWLAKELTNLSIPVTCCYTVGDDAELISQTLKCAVSLSDIIILTGGLGPTDDDITRDGVASYLGEKLVFDQDSFQKIKSYFHQRNYPMPEKNKVQAYFPESAEIIPNNLGTAPAFKVQKDNKFIFAVPGVPSEMKKIFEESILPSIQNFNTDQIIKSYKIHIFGIGESTAAEMLGDLMERKRNPLINCTVSVGIITLHIIARAKNEQECEKLIQSDIRNLKNIFKDLIFGYQQQSLSEVVADGLLHSKKTVALAESCTGGLIAKMLTDIPGSSNFFTHGWVTYSNQAKISQLNVSQPTLEKYGAISAEVAREMAFGAAKASGSDFAVAVTGIAGPGGGSEQKPVGLVYIAVYDGEKCEVGEYKFTRTRDFIRLRTAQTALDLLRRKMKFDV